VKNLTIWVTDDTGDAGLAAGADLTVETLDQIDAASPELPSPPEVTDAVVPIILASEWRVCVLGRAHKAPDGVGVQTQEEGDEQVVGVPERLERLLPDAVVGRRVHEQHAEQHDVAGNAAGLRVVNLDGSAGANLVLLDVKEAG